MRAWRSKPRSRPATSPAARCPTARRWRKCRGEALTDALRCATGIRERCRAVAALVDDGRSAHFTLDRTQLPAVADRVARITCQRYPGGDIPLHSRWRHFGVGALDRKGELDARLAARTAVALARARIDL